MNATFVKSHYRRYPQPKQQTIRQVKLCENGCGVPATHSDITLCYRCHVTRCLQ